MCGVSRLFPARDGSCADGEGWVGLQRGEGQGVGDGGVDEGEGEGGAAEPGEELVEEPGAGGIAGFAGGDVGVGVVGVGEVGGEALAGAEVEAGLLDGGSVAAVGMEAGAGGDSEEGAEGGVAAEDGVGDLDGADGAVRPGGEVAGGVGEVEAALDGGGEEFVPVGEGVGEPACGSVLQDQLEG